MDPFKRAQLVSQCAVPNTAICCMTADQFITLVRIVALCDVGEIPIVHNMMCTGCRVAPSPATTEQQQPPDLDGGAAPVPVPPTADGDSEAQPPPSPQTGPGAGGVSQPPIDQPTQPAGDFQATPTPAPPLVVKMPDEVPDANDVGDKLRACMTCFEPPSAFVPPPAAKSEKMEDLCSSYVEGWVQQKQLWLLRLAIDAASMFKMGGNSAAVAQFDQQFCSATYPWCAGFSKTTTDDASLYGTFQTAIVGMGVTAGVQRDPSFANLCGAIANAALALYDRPGYNRPLGQTRAMVRLLHGLMLRLFCRVAARMITPSGYYEDDDFVAPASNSMFEQVTRDYLASTNGRQPALAQLTQDAINSGSLTVYEPAAGYKLIATEAHDTSVFDDKLVSCLYYNTPSWLDKQREWFANNPVGSLAFQKALEAQVTTQGSSIRVNEPQVMADAAAGTISQLIAAHDYPVIDIIGSTSGYRIVTPDLLNQYNGL